MNASPMSTVEDAQRGIALALSSSINVRVICKHYRIATFKGGQRRLDSFGVKLTEINPKLLQRVWDRLDSR